MELCPEGAGFGRVFGAVPWEGCVRDVVPGGLFFGGCFGAVPGGLFCGGCSRGTARGRGGGRRPIPRASPGAASIPGPGRGGEVPLWGPAPGDSAAPEPTGLSTGPFSVRSRGTGQRGARPGVGRAGTPGPGLDGASGGGH